MMMAAMAVLDACIHVRGSRYKGHVYTGQQMEVLLLLGHWTVKNEELARFPSEVRQGPANQVGTS